MSGLTSDDKRAAILRELAYEYPLGLTAREIAFVSKVDHRAVAMLLRSMLWWRGPRPAVYVRADAAQTPTRYYLTFGGRS